MTPPELPCLTRLLMRRLLGESGEFERTKKQPSRYGSIGLRSCFDSISGPSKFGPGIYWADDWKKSDGYTSRQGGYWSGGGGGVRGRGAFMFAANVAVGNPHVADGPRGYTSPPKGHHSIFGKAGHSQVQNNEWIIFDSGQNTLAYLVEYDTKNPRY